MRRVLFSALAVVVLGVPAGCVPSGTGLGESYVVAGVEADDMLKLRAGPGIGFRVIAGLPNGAVLRAYNCQQSGSTRWCEVTLKQSGGLKGYVSSAYLRKI